ncbi:MAG: hypothetical protein HYS07_04930 [Chlamydiae bacterium]|nr:hypothetical protein [Chlamydiota bacterium]MBI3276235.1 hypothetical protein [Chlamydiota bacterium]
MSAIVAFFETQDQLKFLLRYSAQNYLKPTYVALTPEADYAAEKLGLAYHIIDDFHDETELIEMGLRNYERVQAFCDYLDSSLKRSILSDYRCGKAFSSHFFFFYLKVLFDAVLNYELRICRALLELKPTRVLFFDTRPDRIEDNLFFRDESLSSRLLPLFLKDLNCTYTAFSTALAPFRRLRSTFRTGLKGLASLSRRWENISSDMNFSFNGMPSLILTDLYADSKPLGELWLKRGTGKVINLKDLLSGVRGDLPQRDTLQLCHLLWERLSKDENFKSFFTVGNKNYFSIVETRLKHFITFVIPRCLTMTDTISKKIPHGSKAVILGSQYAEVGQIACAIAGHFLKIPVVCYQHGGMYGYVDYPIIEHHDLYAANYFFCYGEGVRDSLREATPSAYRASEKRRAKIIPVGSISLDVLSKNEADLNSKVLSEIASNLPKNKKIVIYVNTNLMGQTRYFTHHSYPDIWYWRLQQEVIRVCSKFQDVYVLAKFHSGDRVYHPVDEWLRREKISNCVIIRSISFSEMLKLGDLFIIDCPSTTLLQSLLTDKKVIVFSGNPFIQFDPKAVKQLKKRVVFSETKEQFLKDIEVALRKSEVALPRPLDREFFNAYGSYKDDRRSAERAVNELVELM